MRWEVKRNALKNDIGRITPENIIAKILEKEENWRAVTNYAKFIIDRKEKDTRLAERRDNDY